MIWRKIESCGVAVLAGLLFVVTLVIGYMMFLDGTIVNPVVIYENTTLEVDKGIYAPGEVVMARNQFYKHRNIKGTMKWNLVDHVVTPYVSKEVSLPAGVSDIWFPVERLPDRGCKKGHMYHFRVIS